MSEDNINAQQVSLSVRFTSFSFFEQSSATSAPSQPLATSVAAPGPIGFTGPHSVPQHPGAGLPHQPFPPYTPPNYFGDENWQQNHGGFFGHPPGRGGFNPHGHFHGGGYSFAHAPYHHAPPYHQNPNVTPTGWSSAGNTGPPMITNPYLQAASGTGRGRRSRGRGRGFARGRSRGSFGRGQSQGRGRGPKKRTRKVPPLFFFYLVNFLPLLRKTSLLPPSLAPQALRPTRGKLKLCQLNGRPNKLKRYQTFFLSLYSVSLICFPL